MYTVFRDREIMFHVSTKLPFTEGDTQQVRDELPCTAVSEPGCTAAAQPGTAVASAGGRGGSSRGGSPARGSRCLLPREQNLPGFTHQVPSLSA